MEVNPLFFIEKETMDEENIYIVHYQITETMKGELLETNQYEFAQIFISFFEENKESYEKAESFVGNMSYFILSEHIRQILEIVEPALDTIVAQGVPDVYCRILVDVQDEDGNKIPLVWDTRPPEKQTNTEILA